MNVKTSYNISHFKALILGLLFYTSIGLLFVISNVPLRVFVFLLLILVANLKKQHFIIILISCVVGFLISPFSNWQLMILNILSWGALTGSILCSILIYEKIFSGGDFASVSKFFKSKNKVAINSYYVFKVIPMIFDLLDRLTKAYIVYGKKKYIGEKKLKMLNLFFDVIDSFFNELLTLMFSQIRIMNRREAAAYFVSQGKRKINIKLLVIQMLIILLVIASFTLYILNINIQYIDKFK